MRTPAYIPPPVAPEIEYDPLQWPSPLTAAELVVRVTYEGLPVSKARARFNPASGRRPYTPTRTVEYEQSLAWKIRLALGSREPDAESRFGLRCVFYRPTRQRIDCDNLIKAVSDAATGLVWKDDSQVLEVIGRLFLAADRPHVEFAIYRVPDTAPRPRCRTCGKPYSTYPSIDDECCSTECRRAARSQSASGGLR